MVLSEEAKPFLGTIPEEEHDEECPTMTPRKLRSKFHQRVGMPNQLWTFICLGFILETVQIGFFAAIFFGLRPTKFVTQIPRAYSPANQIVSYENQTVGMGGDAFMGQPGEEMEQAWDSLLEGTLLRVFDAELDQLQYRESVIPLSGGGYAGGLGISHDLHCLKRVHKYTYLDYYYPSATQHQKERLKHHLIHCVDSLRRSLLCRPDTSVVTLSWEGTITGKPATTPDKTMTCVNWDQLHDWMLSRAVDQREMIMPDGTQFTPILSDF